jgi:uncharacterized membrane protein YphA (DoxX/SURF4 family)
MEDAGQGTTNLKSVVSLVGAVFLGAVLIIATIGKLADPILFIEQIRTEGLEGILSARAIAIIALALETGLGIALFLGVRNKWVLIPTAALVAFFIALTGRAYWLVLSGQVENTYSCGCFGVFLERTASEAFWQDLFLLVPPLVLAFCGWREHAEVPAKRRIMVAALGTIVVVVYSSLVVKLPSAVTDAVPFEASDTALCQETQQFALFVEGQEDPDARVLECDATLQFLVFSSSLSSPLIIDIRTTEVRTLENAAVAERSDGSFTLDGSVKGETVGSFEVGTGGLSFDLDGKAIEMRNR